MNGTMSQYKPETFMEYVQLHERTWGDEDYPNRPDLIDILRAHVCVFWLHNEDGRRRYSVTLHSDMRAIEEYMTQLIFRRNAKDTSRRIARIFTNGKPTRIKGVKILFETQDPHRSKDDVELEDHTDSDIAGIHIEDQVAAFSSEDFVETEDVNQAVQSQYDEETQPPQEPPTHLENNTNN